MLVNNNDTLVDLCIKHFLKSMTVLEFIKNPLIPIDIRGKVLFNLIVFTKTIIIIQKKFKNKRQLKLKYARYPSLYKVF
jgi:hypothetical protein